MPIEKTEFYWAIIGDSSPEPVAVTGKEPHRLAYTIGCPDPFIVDGPESNIQLIPDQWRTIAEPITIPQTPKEKEQRRKLHEKRLEADRKRGVVHGYAGFGARARP